MAQTIFTYPATLEPDEDGRPVVSFPDLPGAVTDGADEAEALTEAVDCLSEALATRIAHGEEIPPPSPALPRQHLVSPDPTIALKAALYQALRQRDMTVADLAQLLQMDWHLAARLIDPKRSSKLTSLAAALGALGCRIAISVEAAPAKPAPAVGEEGTGQRVPSVSHRQTGRPARRGSAGAWIYSTNALCRICFGLPFLRLP